MKVLALTAFSISLIISCFVACTTAPSLQIPAVSGQTVGPVKKTMHSFKSDQDLLAYLKKIAEERKRVLRKAGQASNIASAAPAEPCLSGRDCGR